MAIHRVEHFLNRGVLKVSASDTFGSLDDLLRVFRLPREAVVYYKPQGGEAIRGGVQCPGGLPAHLWWPVPSPQWTIGQQRPDRWYNIFEGDTITEFRNDKPGHYRDVLAESQGTGTYRIVFKRTKCPAPQFGTFQFVGVYELDVDATLVSRKAVWRRNTEIDEFPIDINVPTEQITLNEQQQAFVDLPSDKNIRLLAPAGSGKTQTLLYRCKKLLTENPGQRVLLVTFTKKACEELKSRLIKDTELSGLYSKIKVSTLNSFGNEIVCRMDDRARLIEEKDFASYFNRIFSLNECSEVFQRNFGKAKWREQNAKALVRMVDRFKSLGFDHEQLNTPQLFAEYWAGLVKLGAVDLLEQYIEELRGMNLVPERGNEEEQHAALYENFWLFCQSVIRKMRNDGLYTLEDQKYWGWLIIRKLVNTKGNVCYNHIMVDEFQDINPLDLNFIKVLRDRYVATVTVVGDDDQAIFEWRGAIPEYILHPEVYLGGEFITQILEINYRSPRNIVAVAKRLIDFNQNRVRKEMRTHQDIEAEVVRCITSNIGTVMEAIIADAMKNDYKSLVVIARKRSHLIAPQMQLLMRHVPFVASGDINLFLSSAFTSLSHMLQLKDSMAKGQLVEHDQISVAMTDVLALIAEKPFSEERRAVIQMYFAASDFVDLNSAIACVNSMPNDVVGDAFAPAMATNTLARFFAATDVSGTIHEIGESFSGLKKDFTRADEDIFLSDPPFEELERLAVDYGEDFGRFKADIDQSVQKRGIVLFPDEDGTTSYMNGQFPKIELTTALRTKGGQFDVVYILHANEDTWPIKHARTNAQLEAERRLFYVAITRTKKKLAFVIDEDNPPSPYLRDLNMGGA